MLLPASLQLQHSFITTARHLHATARFRKETLQSLLLIKNLAGWPAPGSAGARSQSQLVAGHKWHTCAATVTYVFGFHEEYISQSSTLPTDSAQTQKQKIPTNVMGKMSSLLGYFCVSKKEELQMKKKKKKRLEYPFTYTGGFKMTKSFSLFQLQMQTRVLFHIFMAQD